MCAPSSVGAIEPVGMTKASTMKARKTKARMKATRIDSTVSLTPPEEASGDDFSCEGEGEGGAGSVMSAWYASLGRTSKRSAQSAWDASFVKIVLDGGEGVGTEFVSQLFHKPDFHFLFVQVARKIEQVNLDLELRVRIAEGGADADIDDRAMGSVLD